MYISYLYIYSIYTHCIDQRRIILPIFCILLQTERPTDPRTRPLWSEPLFTPCSPTVTVHPGDTSDHPFIIVDSYSCSDDDDDNDVHLPSSVRQTPPRTITPPLIIIEDDSNEDRDDIKKEIYDCRPGEPIGLTHHIQQIHYHSKETELERIYRDIRLGLVARTDP